MTTHLKMDKPDNRNRLDDLAQGVIGQPLDRPDGPLKVSGRATYANEYAVDNLAQGVLVRATAAKGRVSRVDAEAVGGRHSKWHSAPAYHGCVLYQQKEHRNQPPY